MSKYHLIINKSTALLLTLATIFIAAEYKNVHAQEADSNTTIEEIAEEENNTIGEEVTVRGKVEEVESGVSFLIEEGELFGEDKVLVINVSDRIVPATADNPRLQVTGEVGTLILADVEREYGLDLDPEFYVEYESKPVILANYIVLSPELEELVENPDIYYSQEIAVEGKVSEIKNDYGFTLKEDQLIGGESLLIINVAGKPIPAQDETVVVTGMLRPFVKAEFERDYDLTWDLDVQEQIEAEYTEKPVLVVDSIYSSAKDEGLLE